MLRKKTFLQYSFFFPSFFQGCASYSNLLYPGESAGRASGWYWDESRKALAYGGGEKPKTPGQTRTAKESSAVKEINPRRNWPKIFLSRTQPPSRRITSGPVSRVKKSFFRTRLKFFEKKPEYKIGIDDVLSILIWNHPDLSVPAVIVRRDGMISLPLIGNVKVEGLMVPEVEEVLNRELSRFLTRPQVTVNRKR